MPMTVMMRVVLVIMQLEIDDDWHGDAEQGSDDAADDADRDGIDSGAAALDLPDAGSESLNPAPPFSNAWCPN